MISQNTNSKILWSIQIQNCELKETKESENSAGDFSKRQDVINKASLRHMRKYYVDHFKKKNPKIIRARFCNVRSTEAMNAVKKLSQMSLKLTFFQRNFTTTYSEF